MKNGKWKKTICLILVLCLGTACSLFGDQEEKVNGTEMDRLVNPIIGVFQLDYFDPDQFITPDQLVELYYNSQKEMPEKNEKGKVIENFAEKYFGLDVKTMQESSFYDSDEKVYRIPDDLVPLGEVMLKKQGEVVLEDKSVKITVYCLATPMYLPGYELECVYELHLSGTDKGAKVLGGKSIRSSLAPMA